MDVASAVFANARREDARRDYPMDEAPSAGARREDATDVCQPDEAA